MTVDTDHHDSPPPSEEPEAAAGELARRCGLCHASIAGEVFTLGDLVVCPPCARAVEQRQTGRSRMRRSLVFGAVATVLLAALWYLATAASSRSLSGVAVLAGIVIGLAVHRGAAGRGGLRYQIAAALLVYAAFVARYVPPVFGGIADAIRREHTALATAPSQREAPPATTSQPPSAPSTAPAAAPPTQGSAAGPSTLATLKAYFVFTAVAWGLVLAAPFLPGSLGAWSLLSLALGMAAAVYLNRRVCPRGPFPGAGPS